MNKYIFAILLFFTLNSCTIIFDGLIDAYLDSDIEKHANYNNKYNNRPVDYENDFQKTEREKCIKNERCKGRYGL